MNMLGHPWMCDRTRLVYCLSPARRWIFYSVLLLELARCLHDWRALSLGRSAESSQKVWGLHTLLCSVIIRKNFKTSPEDFKICILRPQPTAQRQRSSFTVKSQNLTR
ncbi:hypothetical protein F442_11752 [Phytophthora nicotianae P10297]|uniref:Uncharacterized protein n=3 Tax=Phytophthora nicotianae TaxID=4792 RepID=W2Z1P7_PHYNI|nr:hypothetical protein L916_11461 [Phytophthora nicotianae]ETO71774.1 hypothetical protein F444_11926 [Phytophthora nicotianae P1976]ETP40990.1 hypothetical protein F442_11752 [Phytophthora nicotianae P10297]